MNPIGTILDFCVNTQCKIIPFGYLECDGKIIEKQKYIELFYSLNINDSKRIVQKPFDKILIKRNIVFLTNGEVNVQLPYEQLNNNMGKCILISPDGHSLFIYGVKENSINELEIIKNFLNEHPAYPVMVDNGRYLFYFVGENITKDDFVCGGLHKIDELYTIGFCKDTK